MNKYVEWKQKNSKKFNQLNTVFAMNKKDLQRQATKNNCKITDFVLIFTNVLGTYIKKDEYSLFVELNKQIQKEKKQLFNDYSFLYDAFMYELYNHEYCITYDYDRSLEDLNLTIEQINKNAIQKKAFEQARKDYSNNHNMYL